MEELKGRFKTMKFGFQSLHHQRAGLKPEWRLGREFLTGSGGAYVISKMHVFINTLTAVLIVVVGMLLPTTSPAQDSPANSNRLDLEYTIRAVVTPAGGAVFVVTNYERAALAKALEVHRKTLKEPTSKVERGGWEPEIIKFNTPEELYSSVREVRKLPGFQTLSIYMKCGTKFSGSTGTCTGTGTNTSRIVYFDRWMCKAAGQNDSCWTQTLKIGETRFYNSEKECATNAKPRCVEPIWDNNFCSVAAN